MICKNIVEAFGFKFRIPKGYRLVQESQCVFMDDHGVEYALVKHEWKDDVFVCLETIYSKHVRMIELEQIA